MPKKLANHAAAENRVGGVHHRDIQWYKHCNKQALAVPLQQCHCATQAYVMVLAAVRHSPLPKTDPEMAKRKEDANPTA